METPIDPNHFLLEFPETEEDLLKYTNRVRLYQANKILSDVDIKVTDNKTQATLDKYLSGIDRQIIGTRRLSAQEKLGDGISDLATALDSYFKKTTPEGAGFKRHEDDISDAVITGPANATSINIPKREFIDGQLTASGTEINIEQIMSEGRQKQRGG